MTIWLMPLLSVGHCIVRLDSTMLYSPSSTFTHLAVMKASFVWFCWLSRRLMNNVVNSELSYSVHIYHSTLFGNGRLSLEPLLAVKTMLVGVTHVTVIEGQ
jgi:hypothetical protein